ncbi:YqaA family protein [Pseudomonadota bacterium]
MKIFSTLYELALRWAAHRHASWYLGGLSFAESSFFPIPPDVMLAPMTLAQREKAWRFATITTITSVLGGLLGYAIGMFAFDMIEPLLHEYNKWDKFQEAVAAFEKWGVWVIFIAGFSPVPYKLFTICAGTFGMALFPFMIASLIGRGARFFLVAGLIRWGGEKMEAMLRTYVDRIGWAVVIAAVILVLFLNL